MRDLHGPPAGTVSSRIELARGSAWQGTLGSRTPSACPSSPARCDARGCGARRGPVRSSRGPRAARHGHRRRRQRDGLARRTGGTVLLPRAALRLRRPGLHAQRRCLRSGGRHAGGWGSRLHRRTQAPGVRGGLPLSGRRAERPGAPEPVLRAMRAVGIPVCLARRLYRSCCRSAWGTRSVRWRTCIIGGKAWRGSGWATPGAAGEARSASHPKPREEQHETDAP